MEIKKGIEVGHIFKLGTKYSESMNFKIQIENENRFLEMGCYGIGISRIVAASIEQNNDEKGTIADSGKVNKVVLKKLVKNFYNKEKILNPKSIKSFDTKHFNFSFGKKISIEDGAATLTEFTAEIIISELQKNQRKPDIILCGGGRKNNFLVEKLKKKISNIKLIDIFGVDGDFVESQAFAYIAIRSFLKFPISFPETTGVNKPCLGGIIVKN